MTLVFVAIMILFIALSACSAQLPRTSPEPQSTSPPATEITPSQPSDGNASGEPATSSQVILKYWEAMNSYDLELALSYYEKDYRKQEEEEVRGDISMLSQHEVTLSVKEISEPIYISEDRVRHDMILGTPIGERNLTYLLEQINGDWKIYL